MHTSNQQEAPFHYQTQIEPSLSQSPLLQRTSWSLVQFRCPAQGKQQHLCLSTGFLNATPSRVLPSTSVKVHMHLNLKPQCHVKQKTPWRSDHALCAEHHTLFCRQRQMDCVRPYVCIFCFCFFLSRFCFFSVTLCVCVPNTDVAETLLRLLTPSTKEAVARPGSCYAGGVHLGLFQVKDYRGKKQRRIAALVTLTKLWGRTESVIKSDRIRTDAIWSAAMQNDPSLCSLSPLSIQFHRRNMLLM